MVIDGKLWGLGSWLLDLGSWPLALGSWLLAEGSWLLDEGSLSLYIYTTTLIDTSFVAQLLAGWKKCLESVHIP